MLEIAATFVDEVVGNILDDASFAAVNLIEPYTAIEIFIAYLVTVAAAALIVRARGADDHERMNNIFSQTIISCAICGAVLTLVYVVFTPQFVRFVADDPAVYEKALGYFTTLRFYPLVDVFDTFLFTYVLYRGGYLQFYTAIFTRIGLNAFLSWYLGSQMGLMGVGLASVLSIIVALLIKATFLFSKKHGIKFRWHFNLREALQIAKLGFPESAFTVFIAIMELAVNAFALDTYGVSVDF